MLARQNVDSATVEGFGQEWRHYDQSALSDAEAERIFDSYFGLFDFTDLGEGFDLGCGSGRWARLVAPKARKLHCIDPSEAIEVARANLSDLSNVEFHRASADEIPLPDGSQDFGYSLGVLHHIPDTQKALNNAVGKLKPGGQMLLYIYYSLDNRNALYRGVWKVSDAGRKLISRLPFPLRRAVTTAIAAGLYWPLAMTARLVERVGADPSQIPLSPYRWKSFYTMRTDALDRLGTRLEQRFSRSEIEQMMLNAGLTDIRFSETEPYWVAIGRRVRGG
jgi:ubiquinone/menaquinone biosynthesis C-methylase UbiE